VASSDLIATLRARGVATCLVVDESRPHWPGFEVDAEFATGWDQVERVTAGSKGTPLERSVQAAALALERLAERQDWLLWLDLATPLPPWNVPDEFLQPYFTEEPAEQGQEEERSEEEKEEEEEILTPIREVSPGPIDPDDDNLFLSLQSSCAAAVSYLDAGVGQLLELLAEQPAGREVAVVFTGDCGLPLGEHGVVGLVRPEPYDEVIHIPLVIRLPGLVPRRLGTLTQAADLAPTLAELFGVRLPEVQGQSLLPVARGEVERLRDHVCAGIRAGGGIGWCLRTPDWEFVLPIVQPSEGETRGPRLYVKVDDRWEVNDVIQHHPERAEALERTLHELVTASCPQSQNTPLATDEHG
jgi:arylsulfatase A-like enzyme